jgi:KDO transferase-3
VALERDQTGRLAGMRIRSRTLACVNGQIAMQPEESDEVRECHLIATGPSVNSIDYRALPMQHVLGVNGAIALAAKQGVRFDFYCIVDTGFVCNRPDLVERVIAEPLTLFATPLVLWHIVERFGIERLRCRVFILDDMLFTAGRRAPKPSELQAIYDSRALALFDTPQPLGFSLDLRRGVFDGRTVAYTGLQVLVALGFRRLFLHGVDLASARRTPRFYESAGDMQPSYLDENFADFIEPSFRHAAALLARRGIDVRNLSLESALGDDIFPKLHWQSLVPGAARERATISGAW